MSFRGRGPGGGRGWGGRGQISAKELEFEDYPQDVELPGKIDLNDDYMKKLLSWSSKFQRYWKASPYLLEEKRLNGCDSRKMHIERFSDRKRTRFTRDSLSQVLIFDNFPEELTQGASKRRQKKFKWNPEANLEKKLDFFERLEKRNEGKEGKDEQEKEPKEDEDEDEDKKDEEDDEYFSDDDYAPMENPDDDDDDYNDVEEGQDEDIF